MTILDRVFLLAAGLIALYLGFRFLSNYRRETNRPLHYVYYLISFTVLLVAGLLLIFLGYDILANSLVVIVAALIPAFLATGLISQFYPKIGPAYLIFAIIGIIAIAITRFTGSDNLATIVLVIVHSICAVTVIAVPLLAASKGTASGSIRFVTVGGILISVGGIALAFLKAGAPILSADVIFTILAPLLFLMTACFAFGLIKGLPSSK